MFDGFLEKLGVVIVSRIFVVASDFKLAPVMTRNKSERNRERRVLSEVARNVSDLYSLVPLVIRRERLNVREKVLIIEMKRRHVRVGNVEEVQPQK